MDKRQEPLNPEAVAQFLADKGIVSMEQVESLVEPSLFVIIPIIVKERRDLSANAKLLYGEIMALARRKGYCYATNQYIAERMGLVKSSITAIIKELKDKNLIDVEIERAGEGTYRRIVINPISYQSSKTIDDKVRGGSLERTGGVSSKTEGGSAVERPQKRYRQRDIDNKSIKEDVSKETQKTENPLKEKTNSGSLKEEKNPNPNSANPLSLTKTDTPTKKKSKSYGNEDINNIYGYLKEKLLGTPDGTIKQNRIFAQHLLNKFRKDYPEGDPVVNVHLLIDLAMKDEFHSKNATSFRYLYNNSQKIIQSAKGRFTNPKYISFKK